jgi:hypothetical protein
MLMIGYVFNKVEALIPSIPAEYATSMFRDWPGWTKGYMLAHPIWFGFVFAIGFGVVNLGRPTGSWVAAGCGGAGYGVLLFFVGSLPILLLVYASFRVSPQLVAVSWAARNLSQYIVAGTCVGIETSTGGLSAFVAALTKGAAKIMSKAFWRLPP